MTLLFETELKLRFVHHILKFFLNVFDHFRFFSCTLTCKLNVDFVLSLLGKDLLLEFKVPHLQGPLRCILASFIMHILSIVSFLVGCDVSDSSCEEFIFRCKFILCLFRRLLLFRLLGFLSEPSQILFRLLIIIFLFFLFSIQNLCSLSI